MFSLPPKSYFDHLSEKTDFNRGSLEKAYRLLYIVKEMGAVPGLAGRLAFKGGTAIQFAYLGMRRLSVDIDLNYVGSPEKEVMEGERAEIRVLLDSLLRSQDYRFDRPRAMYLEEQFELGYTTVGGSTDKLKAEINYGERLPVLGVERVVFEHPFDEVGFVENVSYRYEEIMAQKVRALVSRGTARDLYDVWLFVRGKRKYDPGLFRKLFVFYMVLNKDDARKVTNRKIRDITKDDIKRWLVPMLRRRDHRIELEGLRAPVLEFVRELLEFNKMERRFLDKFYDEGIFDQELLFGNTPVKKDLSKHPMVLWRLHGAK
ncbi:MAG: nucleotidyl transferase AbiEii/AbiGii toxin family protein [Candidatus Thermoplasmatota archaeon]